MSYDGRLSVRVKSSTLLTPDEVNELSRRWRDDRDVRARNTLVIAYTQLARSVAYKYYYSGVAHDELFQQARLGVLRAADKYDPDKNTLFSTYAIWWIKASIGEYLRNIRSVVRDKRSGSARIPVTAFKRGLQAYEQTVRATHGTPLTDEVRSWIADYTGHLKEHIEKAERLVFARDVSLNTPVHNGEGTELIDFLPDESLGTEWLCTVDEARVSQILREALATLSLLERYIIIRRHYTEPPGTLEEIGSSLGRSGERVRQLQKRALQKLKRYLSKRLGAGVEDLFRS